MMAAAVLTVPFGIFILIAAIATGDWAFILGAILGIVMLIWMFLSGFKKVGESYDQNNQ